MLAQRSTLRCPFGCDRSYASFDLLELHSLAYHDGLALPSSMRNVMQQKACSSAGCPHKILPHEILCGTCWRFDAFDTAEDVTSSLPSSSSSSSSSITTNTKDDSEIGALLLSLPSEMLAEVLARTDAASALCCALTCSSLWASFLALPRASFPLLPGRRFLYAVCESGHVRQFDWLEELNVQLVRAGKAQRYRHRFIHIAKAAQSGSLALVKILHQIGVPLDAGLAEIAARHGRQEILAYLLEHGVRFDSLTYAAIGATGSLALTLWAEEHTHFLTRSRPNMFVTFLILGAIRHGHKDVVQHLFDNYNAKPQMTFVSEAASHGHFELMAWLFDQVDMSELNEFVNDLAHYPEHFVRTLEFLVSRGAPFDRTNALASSTWSGNLSAIRFLTSHFKLNFGNGDAESLASELCEVAINIRALDVLRYFLEELHLPLTDPYLFGHAHVVAYKPVLAYFDFHGHFKPAQRKSILSQEEFVEPVGEERARYDRFNALLGEQCIRPDDRAFERCIRSNANVEVLQILDSYYHCRIGDEAVRAALETLDMNTFRDMCRAITFDPAPSALNRLYAEERGQWVHAQILLEETDEILALDRTNFDNIQNDLPIIYPEEEVEEEEEEEEYEEDEAETEGDEGEDGEDDEDGEELHGAYDWEGSTDHDDD